jgi:hypothetical protein
MAAGPACGKDRLRFADRFIIAGTAGKVNRESGKNAENAKKQGIASAALSGCIILRSSP